MTVSELNMQLPTTAPEAKPVDETTPLLAEPICEQPLPSSELYGYILMALSTLGYSGMSFFTHIAENKYGISVASSVFVRAVIHTTFSTVYILCFLNTREMLSRFSTTQRLLLIARGVAGSIGMVLVYTSLQKLPVGDAIAVYFCNPVITMMLSAALLGEAITRADGLAAFMSFAGILLIARPGFNDEAGIVSNSDRIIGSLAAFAGAWLGAAAYVIVRFLGTSVHFMTSVFSLSFACILTSVLLGGFIGPSGLIENKEGAINIIVAALFAFAGQVCLNKGLQHCRAGPGVLIRNLDVPISYVLGMLFLGEAPHWFSFVGAGFVLSGTLMLALRAVLRR